MNVDDAMRRLLQEGGRGGFEPGFADRVMARVAVRSAGTFAVPMMSLSLQRYFLRLAPVALALLIGLGLFNLAGRRSQGQNAIDAVLGLPAVTIAAAYDMDGAP